jgi:hypothetical protein
MKKIVQINFKFKIKRSELEQNFLKMAPMFGPSGSVKGLLWKIWLMNEAEKTTGGIYLFKDEASAEAYLKGEIIAGLKTNPAISNAEIKVFDILTEPTKISRGPVD